MSILRAERNRRYSVAGVGVGVGVAEPFGVGEDVVVDLAGGEIAGVVTADGAADAPGVALGEADGLIGTVLIGSSCCARDFFWPSVFGFSAEVSSFSFGETEGEMMARGGVGLPRGLIVTAGPGVS